MVAKAFVLATLILCSLLFSVVRGANNKSLRTEAEPDRELAGYIGRQIPNNCASIYASQVLNGRTCSAPCNNPCAKLDTTGAGCGSGSYCACGYAANDPWRAKPPVAKCAWCPYMKAGTTCPGDGFYYDKSYPAPAPIVRAPVAPPVRMAPACGGNQFGTCQVGQYCRQKSTDWTYVCTACPTGLVCPGDGTRKTPPVPANKPTRRSGDKE